MFNNLALWRPFDELWTLSDPFEMMRSSLQRFRTGTSLFSSADLTPHEDGWRLRVAIPGIAPEHVEVNATPQSLRIRAVEQDGNGEVAGYERTISLPGSVDSDKINATFRHGLLEITLPLKETAKARRIAIGSSADTPKQLNSAA